MQKILTYLLLFLVLVPVGGELLRVPLGGFDLLPSDLILLVLYPTWLWHKIRSDRRIRIGSVGKVTFVFIGVLLITFLLNALRFPASEMFTAGAYLIRFLMYLGIGPLIYDLLSYKKTFLKTLGLGAFISFGLIAFLGFLQLKFFPNFLKLGLHYAGWDPHIGRLTSTWMDPNFVGGYLALMISVVTALALYFRQKRNRAFYLIFVGLAGLGLLALYLTFSRSAYLTFLAALFVVAFFKSRKLLVATVLVALLAFAGSARVQERVLGAVDSAKALLGLDAQTPLDPTAELRVWSWSFAREIITDHPYLGIGFSRYKFEINNRGHGLLTDHAAGGSDSSLLTLWATSGIFGLLSFLAIGFVAFVKSLRFLETHDDRDSYLMAGLVGGFAGMLVHSVFVNSLLYPPIMIFVYGGLGILDFLCASGVRRRAKR